MADEKFYYEKHAILYYVEFHSYTTSCAGKEAFSWIFEAEYVSYSHKQIHSTKVPLLSRKYDLLQL